MTLSQSLPTRFPIFPLSGALLLPRGNLPLNIFEPRYLQMVRDAMKTDQIIGMIQPRAGASDAVTPEIFATGCAGRISNFAETQDGRYEITLTGVNRFDVKEELAVTTPYRQVVASFDRWHDDLVETAPLETLKLDLLPVLKSFFDFHQIEAEWHAIDHAPISGLITSLAMICPFEAAEKQALLEAANLEEQGKMLIALMQMATSRPDGGEPVVH